MKIRELIEILSTYDPECEVVSPALTFDQQYSAKWVPAVWKKTTSLKGVPTPLELFCILGQDPDSPPSKASQAYT